MLLESFPQICRVADVESVIAYGSEYINVLHQLESLLTRKRSFYALIEQFRLARKAGLGLHHIKGDQPVRSI
jgi:hypothetical protein